MNVPCRSKENGKGNGKDSVKFRTHFKTDSPDGFNVIIAIDIFQFLSQVANVDLQRAFHAVRRIPADSVEKKRLGDYLGRVLHQEL